MKRIFLFGILILANGFAMGQVKSKSTAAKPTTTNAKSATKANNNASLNAANSVSLNSIVAYPAKTNRSVLSSPQTTFTISDPIITTLDQRAQGANIQFNNSGIVGMPKRAYGFANGKIILSTSGAVTSGTQTGSGAVGTGTSLATFGSIGAPMSVNGKSPYAGINMWGNAMNMNITRRDSSARLTPSKGNNYYQK